MIDRTWRRPHVGSPVGGHWDLPAGGPQVGTVAVTEGRPWRAIPDLLCQLPAAAGRAVLQCVMRQWRAGQMPSLSAATSPALAVARQFAAACPGTVRRAR